MAEIVTRQVAPVVLVEDEAATSDIVRAYLEREGFPTVVCANGGRPLEVIGQTRPRCVILDPMLPEKDGFEICQALRATDPKLAALKSVMPTTAAAAATQQ